MPLQAGARLGPYEIIAPLGSGGMGEVYKARDTRLDRLVAIKILRSDVPISTESRERFEREAWAISRLSHPRVCALFDVGQVDGTSYLVMELVEGETLSARAAKGAMPIPQVLRIGAEIADALAAAHRQGIVHRDLKPANVMITSSGVKLLDFGLAKGLERPEPNSSGDAATVAGPVTREGTWIGTAPYMAPEQLLGKPADERTDVFAFGAVLHEMVTGRRAFEGDTISQITSAIIHTDPVPASSLRADVPAALGRLITECLAKEPDRRWQSAHDVALQLAAIGEPQLVVAPAARTRAMSLAAAAAIIVVGAALGWGLGQGRRQPAPGQRMELQIMPPDRTTFSYSVEAVSFAVSPDGSELAFVSTEPNGVHRGWLRPIASLESKPIAGTEGASSLFWSPDGKAIGFFAGGALKRVDLATGVAVPICEVPRSSLITATWSASGQILFATTEGEAIFAVSTSGGTPSRLVVPDKSTGEARTAFPSFLPDGRRFVYLSRQLDGAGWLMLGEAGQPPRRLFESHSNAVFVEPGYFVFSRSGTLVAQRADPIDLKLVGEPLAVAPSVRFFLTTGAAAFAVSRSGVIAYQSDRDRARLAWIDRSGREAQTVGTAGQGLSLRIASDGRSALVSRALPSTGTFDVWSIDLERGTETRLTLDDARTEIDAVMLPGGQELIFSAPQGNSPRLMRRNLATNQETMLIPGTQFQEADDISPDGRLLAFSERTARGNYNLFTLPLSGQPTPSALRPSAFYETGLRYSPDGKFYSFVSNESGRFELYVAPAAGGAKVPVSAGGAGNGRWSRDGRELFYLSLDGRLIAVPIRTSPALVLGAPETLFRFDGRPWIDFDVSPDGKRFLAMIPELVAAEQPLKAILNWASVAAR